MTRRLTPAERLAATDKNQLLDDIVQASTWDRFLVEQAVWMLGLKGAFSANDARDLLPELGHGFLGAAINGLRNSGLIEHTGRVVPSTSPATKGHRLAVWQLTAAGRQIAARRRPPAVQDAA